MLGIQVDDCPSVGSESKIFPAYKIRENHFWRNMMTIDHIRYWFFGCQAISWSAISDIYMHYAILPHSTLSLTSLDQQDVVYLWCTDTLDEMLSQEVKLFVSHFSCTPSTRQCGEGNFQWCSILHLSETIMSLRIWKWFTSPWRWVAPPLWRPPPWKTQRYQWTLSSCQMQGCQKK